MFAIQRETSKTIHYVGVRQLQSESFALRLVRQVHVEKPRSSGEEYNSAQNVASYARQAIAYASAAEEGSLEILPVLRYYQWLHTLKALLYLFCPTFPVSTSVLQHGLSVRRIKRNSYRWPLEKLLIHREGIIHSFHSLFADGEFPDKILVGDLLGSLPQLAPIMSQFYQHFEHAYPLHSVDADPTLRKVARRIAANQGLTIDEWRHTYYSVGTASPSQDTLEASNSHNFKRDGHARLNEPQGYLYIEEPPEIHPWLRFYDGIEFLVDEPSYPIYLIHYALLYSLSALSRYSATEWSDVIHWHNEEDALLVREYLRLPLPHPLIRIDEVPLTVSKLEWVTDGREASW